MDNNGNFWFSDDYRSSTPPLMRETRQKEAEFQWARDRYNSNIKFIESLAILIRSYLKYQYNINYEVTINYNNLRENFFINFFVDNDMFFKYREKLDVARRLTHFTSLITLGDQYLEYYNIEYVARMIVLIDDDDIVHYIYNQLLEKVNEFEQPAPAQPSIRQPAPAQPQPIRQPAPAQPQPIRQPAPAPAPASIRQPASPQASIRQPAPAPPSMRQPEPIELSLQQLEDELLEEQQLQYPIRDHVEKSIQIIERPQSVSPRNIHAIRVAVSPRNIRARLPSISPRNIESQDPVQRRRNNFYGIEREEIIKILNEREQESLSPSPQPQPPAPAQARELQPGDPGYCIGQTEPIDITPIEDGEQDIIEIGPNCYRKVNLINYIKRKIKSLSETNQINNENVPFRDPLNIPFYQFLTLDQFTNLLRGTKIEYYDESDVENDVENKRIVRNIITNELIELLYNKGQQPGGKKNKTNKKYRKRKIINFKIKSKKYLRNTKRLRR